MQGLIYAIDILGRELAEAHAQISALRAENEALHINQKTTAEEVETKAKTNGGKTAVK